MLTVVGMGPSGLHLMTPAAREAVATADALVGGKRHLLQFPEFHGEQFALGLRGKIGQAQQTLMEHDINQILHDADEIRIQRRQFPPGRPLRRW